MAKKQKHIEFQYDTLSGLGQASSDIANGSLAGVNDQARFQRGTSTPRLVKVSSERNIEDRAIKELLMDSHNFKETMHKSSGNYWSFAENTNKTLVFDP